MRVVTVARNALSALPRGALTVGGGLMVLGASSYGFLFVAARAMTPEAFAGLSVLYVLVFTVGPGIFLPFEQEIARALADRRARGQGSGPLLHRAVSLGSVMLGVLFVGVLAGSVPMTHRLFDGSWLLLVGLLIGLVGLCAAYLTRGVFAGTSLFGTYGVQLAVEGGFRFAACVVLAVAGVRAVGPYGLVLAGAFAVSVLATVRPLPAAVTPGPDARWDELTGAIGWLILGSLLSQVLVNIGPIAVKLLAGPGEKQAAGQLLAGLVLARLPLFLFAAVQAALLPRLAAQLGAERLDLFTSGLRRLLVAVLVLVAAVTALMAAVGPGILHLFFGSRFHLGRTDLVELTVATGLFIAANVLGNGLLALQRFALAAAGWAVGVGVMFGILAAPASLYGRVEHSFVLGAAASTVVFGVLLLLACRHRLIVAQHATAISDVVVGP